ncbi:hypothetical protein [Pseudomonas cremoricolorata]|uniref:hypothetical protein n=1 Tax=Pseudomonas cremoricolorata TaxID=157783 RepID=UPI0012B596FA|nr:hypothetical protein [Pseudomonas cremoricolorata]
MAPEFLRAAPLLDSAIDEKEFLASRFGFKIPSRCEADSHLIDYSFRANDGLFLQREYPGVP